MKIGLTRNVKTPARGTPGSAGLDFFVPNDQEKVVIKPGGDFLFASGVKARVPDGHVLVAMDKSGVATKKKLKVGACVVDSDYQGEIHLHVFNLGREVAEVFPGDKLVQFVLLPVNMEKVEVVELMKLYEHKTKRGADGFGSTDQQA